VHEQMFVLVSDGSVREFELRARDSNPNYLVQSEACCRYTSPHRCRI
jgi:hypothetical protein